MMDGQADRRTPAMNERASEFVQRRRREVTLAGASKRHLGQRQHWAGKKPWRRKQEPRGPEPFDA